MAIISVLASNKQGLLSSLIRQGVLVVVDWGPQAACEHLVAVAQSLRTIAAALRPCGPQAAFYLAAAVSDFYVPWPRMVRPGSQGMPGHVKPCSLSDESRQTSTWVLPCCRPSIRYNLQMLAKA